MGRAAVFVFAFMQICVYLTLGDGGDDDDDGAEWTYHRGWPGKTLH